MKSQKIYRELQKHLNSMPVGFPASKKSGSDIKLLSHIFTPEEAQVACYLSYKPEPLEIIVERIKGSYYKKREIIPKDSISPNLLPTIASPKVLEKILDRIQKKGGIESKIKDGVRYYCNAPLVVGIYEMQVNRLTPQFLEHFNEYSSNLNFGLQFLSLKKPQMRTIPIQKSIIPMNHVSHFDEVITLFENAIPPFVVIDCICRKKKVLEGETCKITDRQETCIAVGNVAITALLMEIGREISRDEAISIIEKNQQDGLVLQPSNTEKLEFICSCCGCCCGMLSIHQKLPIPIDFWSSNFYAAVDINRCNGCGVCKKRCQVGAIKIITNSSPLEKPLIELGKETQKSKKEFFFKAVVDLHSCIGCGLCVTKCSSRAITLIKKEDATKPPLNREELYDIIMADRAGFFGLQDGRLQATLGKLKVVGKILKGIVKTGNTTLVKKL